MGLVLNRDIDLRIFFKSWHFGFAVTEQAHGQARHSLQIFDRDGLAVHKIYLREDDALEAYEALVTRPDLFGAGHRLGGLYDWLKQKAVDGQLAARMILA